MSITITVDKSALDELDEKLHASAKEVMGRIAERLLGAVKRNLASVGPALAASTLAIRKKRGESGTSPLAGLANTLTSRSTPTMAAAGAGFPGLPQQLGFTTGAKSMIPGKDVPARPFALLDDDLIDYATDQIEEFFLG